MPREIAATVAPGADPAAMRIYVNGDETTVAVLQAMNPASIRSVEALACSGLVTLDLPHTRCVYAVNCPDLTELRVPAARWLEVRDCPALATTAEHEAAHERTRASIAETYATAAEARRGMGRAA